MTPRDGLAALVIARHRKGLRRRFAGVFGLFVVFAGIGVPIGVGGTSGSRPGPVALRLGSYTLTLPDRYHLTDAAAAPCAATRVPRPRLAGAAGRGRRAQPSASRCSSRRRSAAGQADPNVPPGAKEVTVGRYRAWLAPRGYAPAGDGAALLIDGGAEAGTW